MPTTVSCFKDFTANHSGDYKAVAEFCRVKPPTVVTWFEGVQFPKGEVLLRLRHFLQLVGYEVDELQQLTSLARDGGALIAFGILSPEEVQVALSYSNLTGVYDVVLRGEGLVAARAYRLEQLVDAHTDALSNRRKELRATYGYGDDAEHLPAAPQESTGAQPSEASKDWIAELALLNLQQLFVLSQSGLLASDVDKLKQVMQERMSGEDLFALALWVNDVLGV